MKNLTILFLLIASTVFGQKHNEQILKFVNNNIGKKVGKGVCYELVERSIKSYDVKFSMVKKTRSCITYGSLVDLKKLYPGDDVYIGDFVAMNADSLAHVGVIYDIGDDGSLYVAEQNTKNTLKESVVVITKLDYEEMERIYGEISYTFYRAK